MRSFQTILALLVGSVLCPSIVNAAPPSTLSHAIKLPKERLQPFLKKHCIRCHGEKKQKGQVRFDQANWVISDNDTAQRWQDVLDQLNGGDMPPEEEDQPAASDMASVITALTRSVNTAKKRLTDHGGLVKMRRLNKREYANTIEHLFGLKVNPDDIPNDGEIVTYDTVGDEQFYTSDHFEKYLTLARKITATSIKLNTKPYEKITSTRVDPEKRVTERMRKDLADKDRKMALKKAGKNWKQMGFKDEGDAKILFSQWTNRAELPRKYLSYPKVDTGVYISDVAKNVSVPRNTDQRAQYIISVHGGIVGKPPEIRKSVRVTGGNQIYGTLKMKGTPNDPVTESMLIKEHMDQRRISASVKENLPNSNTSRRYLGQLGVKKAGNDPAASIWIDWMEIEGPFYPQIRPKVEDLLYPGKPTGGKTAALTDREAAITFIKDFARIAYREKSADSQFLSYLLKDFDNNLKEGMKQPEALAEAMAIIISSPSFLFLHENPAQTKKEYLSKRELAIRLAYFIWSSPPDEELLNANLIDPKTYVEQLDRLLDDPKSQAFLDGFVSQWAEFDRYDAITIDRNKHYYFNEGLQQDAKREVKEFFKLLIDENLPLGNLIDSDFVVVNGALAAHYDIPGVEPDNTDFIKVKLPKDSPRGGLLTQTVFLTAGSNGERSSPVIRGAMVLEKILHDKPAPPPPNVPELDEASDKPMTNREMVLMHQKRSSCASCHKKMDAIGFGLENFDPVGRWRTTEKVGKKSVPIEPGGTLPGGSRFSNVKELKKYLARNEDKLSEELVKSVLSYGIGRTIEFSDAAHVEKILRRLKTRKYGARDLIREAAMSSLFRRK